MEDTLKLFRENALDLKHIESRPNQDSDSAADFNFFITCEAGEAFDKVLVKLKETSVDVLVLNDDPDTEVGSS